MHIFLTGLLFYSCILMVGEGANAGDAKPHWRVVKAPGEPVLLSELDSSGEIDRSEELLSSSDEVRAVAFNDGQTKLAVSTSDRKILVWELRSKEVPSRPLELQSPVAAAVVIQLSPDGKWIGSGDKHGRVTLWELRDNDTKVHTLRRPWLRHPVAILKFSPDSRWLFSASNDRNKYWYFGGLWKLDQQPFSDNGFRLNANVNEFRSASFAPGGRWFVTGHNNESWFWDLESPDPSKNPVIVRRKDMDKGEVELPDGVWKLQTAGDLESISRKTNPKATD